jgi:hypothetical protein
MQVDMDDEYSPASLQYYIAISFYSHHPARAIHPFALLASTAAFTAAATFLVFAPTALA